MSFPISRAVRALFGTTSRLRLLGMAAGVALAPVVTKAPAPEVAGEGEPATVAALIEHLQGSDVTGWELVDAATAAVHRRYRHYSAWHLWETPAESFRKGRGNSNQYNSALAEVLTALGFQLERVHAARVRLERAPWFHSGHTWLSVTIDGRSRDVCASRAENRAGQVSFTPATPVRHFTRLTYVDTSLGLAPFVIAAVWASELTGDPPPRWLYRRFGEAVEIDS